MAVEIGQAAPGFTLYDQDRNERSLGGIQGQERGIGVLSRRVHRSLHYGDVPPCETRRASLTR